MGFDSADYSELADELGEQMIERLVGELLERSETSFETEEVYNNRNFDVNNPQELNSIAMKILNHGEYYKGCRGFILTNGVIVYTPAEHNMVSQIDGIEGTFDFIRKGNIRILHQSIDLCKEPTREQKETLREVIASYSDDKLYVDIFTDDGTVSACYANPDWRRVLGEIDRFFSEGIKLQGVGINESVDNGLNGVNGAYLDGMCDDMRLIINGKLAARYFYEDSTAYPFIISKEGLFIGDSGQTHGQLRLQVFKRINDEDDCVCGRIWVKAKVNDFN
jgi:hypothetical protein